MDIQRLALFLLVALLSVCVTLSRRCKGNPCDNVNCNGGTCTVEENGSTSCLCPENTDGQFCENIVNPCDNVNCNGGTCNVEENGSTSCLCPENTDGQFCENVGNPCDDVNCNGGLCNVEENGSTSCLCPKNKDGQFCENVVSDDCEKNDRYACVLICAFPAKEIKDYTCPNGDTCCAFF